MFQRFLVPTDGSDHALAAARIAGELAQRVGASVIVMVAVEYDVLGGALPGALARELKEQIDQRAQHAVEATARVVRERNVPVETRIVEGKPADAIVATAERLGCDTIVMGSRGLTYATRSSQVLGSVALRVLIISRVPVLVVPPPEEIVE